MSNGKAYVADGSGGLKIFDVTNPLSLTLVGFPHTGSSQAVVVAGDHAYIAAADAGVQIVDVSSPANPKVTGVIQTGGSAQDVLVSGNYAYLADGPAGLRILDLANPTRPAVIATYPGNFQALARTDSHLFTAPFEIFDFANPNVTTAIGTLDDATGSTVAVSGDVAYLSGNSRLRTIDVRNPAAPKTLADFPLKGSGTGLAAAQGNVFIGCDWNGLQVYDVRVPDEPTWLGTYYANASAAAVAVQGRSAYLIVGDEPGLQVIDISDPHQPVAISKLALPAAANIVLMASSYACVTGDGLRVIDVGDPAVPVCVGQYQLSSATFGLQVVGNLAYVCAGENGLVIYRLTPQFVLKAFVVEGSEFRLSWLGGPGISLQRTMNLAQPDWQDVPASEGADGVRLPVGSAASFFRLIRR